MSDSVELVTPQPIFDADPVQTGLGILSWVVFIVGIVFVLLWIILLPRIKTSKNKKKFKIIMLLLAILGVGFVIAAPMIMNTVYKPIIYIYPENEVELSVKLGNPNDIICSYPNYFENDGWSVKAFPNGDLIDLNSNRKLYSLYWEGNFSNIDKRDNIGFCVRGDDTAKFLEEKLDALGLNYKEAEEMIVYWLPILEKNKYNYIRFVTTEEYNEIMPIELKDNEGNEVIPDSLIRILMVYKPLNHRIDVEEQEIKTPQRNGFTVVEWGGCEI